MKIIHKYVLAESAGPFLIGLFTFTLVVLLQRFSRLADLVIAKGVPLSLVGKLLLSLFPTFLEITLPAALLLAVLLALGRLTADSETTALQAAGVGMRGVVFPILLLSGATFLASLYIGWSGVPWGTRQLQETLASILSLRAGAGASEHVFQEIAPGVLLFPDRVSADGRKMTGVLLSQRVAEKDPLLVLAREGEFSPENGTHAVRLHLLEGTIHHEDAAAGVYRTASFRRMEFLLPLVLAGAGDREDPKRLTLPELSRRTATRGKAGMGHSYRYHFHRRLSLASSCLAFGLFALPLGLLQRVRGKSPAFAVTVALIVFYYLFLAAGGALEPWAPAVMVLLIWAPNAIVLGLALWILWRSETRLVPLPALFGRAPGKK
ncbi:MAG TPA: LptF/LptG family permease [Candidatus Limnocylindrales bacterium]|nr:LptF/LptG family permease [Candidatus Limnocylindrales bacterium]